MQTASKINVVNNAGFVLNYSVQWLGSDGAWRTTDWNSGNYPIDQSRPTPELGSIGVPTDALAVTVYVHAILGKSETGVPLIRYESGAGSATYIVTGTTLNYDVKLSGS